MILSAILAAVLAGATATPSVAPSASAVPTPTSSPAPIVLDACRAEYAGSWLLKSISGLRIKFTNEGDKTAKVVRVAVTFNQNTLSVRDVGSFAPNITIDHRFRDLTGEGMRFGLTHEEQPQCRVQFIKYADGTMWAEAPTQAVDSKATVGATPEPEASTTPAP